MPVISNPSYKGLIDSIFDISMVNAFRIAVQEGLTGPLAFGDGFFDEFEDASGVDAGASTDEDYDTTNDLYKLDPGSDLTTTGASISDSDYTGHPKNYGFDDNDTTEWWSDNTDKTVCSLGQDFTTSKAINRVKIKDAGDASSYRPQQIYIESSANGTDWDIMATKAYGDHTNLQTFDFTNPWLHRYWRVRGADNINGANRWKIAEMEMLSVPSGFTLNSISVAAESNNPVTGRVVLFVDYNGETVTLNTDIKAYVSMDGGSNWDQVTLELSGGFDTSDSDKKILVGEGALTARDNKNMEIKFETLNSKNVYLEAWGPFWRYS